MTIGNVEAGRREETGIEDERESSTDVILILNKSFGVRLEKF